MRPLPTPFDRRVQLFTGKGGVGKSTVVAALALAAASRGHRPLILELGHRAAMESLLGVRGISGTPTEIVRGVWAANLRFPATLRDFAARHLRVPRLADALASSDGLLRLLKAAPGVDETLALDAMTVLAERGEYHPLLVDLDATGHALMFLELPRVLEGLVGHGALRRALLAGGALLADPSRAVLHVVARARPLVVDETLELWRRLEAEGAPLGAMIVNAVVRSSLGEDARRLCARAPAAEPLLGSARRELAREASAVEQLGRLTAASRCVLTLGSDRVLHGDSLGPERRVALGRLGESLLGSA